MNRAFEAFWTCVKKANETWVESTFTNTLAKVWFKLGWDIGSFIDFFSGVAYGDDDFKVKRIWRTRAKCMPSFVISRQDYFCHTTSLFLCFSCLPFNSHIQPLVHVWLFFLWHDATLFHNGMAVGLVSFYLQSCIEHVHWTFYIWNACTHSLVPTFPTTSLTCLAHWHTLRDWISDWWLMWHAPVFAFPFLSAVTFISPV